MEKAESFWIELHGYLKKDYENSMSRLLPTLILSFLTFIACSPARGADAPTPPSTPSLALSTDSVDFGTQATNSRPEKTILLFNEGLVGRNLSVEVAAGAGALKLHTNCGLLKFAESCIINVQVSSETPGTQSGVIRVLEEGQVVGTAKVAVQFVQPRLVVPENLDFGVTPAEVQVSRAFTIANKGMQGLQLKRVWLEQEGSAFQLEMLSCTGKLKPAAGCQVRVNLNSAEEGGREAVVHVEAEGERAAVPIKAEVRTIKLEFLEVLGTPMERLAFEEVPAGGRSQKTVHFLNASSIPITLMNEPVQVSGDFSALTTDCVEGVLPAGNYCTIKLMFQSRGEPGSREGELSIRHANGTPRLILVGAVAPR